MLKYGILAAAIAVMTGAPAWAQSAACGAAPATLALVSPAQIGAMSPADALKAKHQAFADITQWQNGPLKTYRDCLDTGETVARRALRTAKSAAAPDAATIETLQGEIDGAEAANTASLAVEERVVTDFHALSSAYCARQDIDRTSCPK